MKYNCPYQNECLLPKAPKDDYRCNIAFEHCIVYKRFRVLDNSQRTKQGSINTFGKVNDSEISKDRVSLDKTVDTYYDLQVKPFEETEVFKSLEDKTKDGKKEMHSL